MAGISNFRTRLRSELEASAALRNFGSGWISGVGGVVCGLASLAFVLCLHFPSLFTLPEIRAFYGMPLFRISLHFALIISFVLSLVSLTLRRDKILGLVGLGATLIATLLGGSRTPSDLSAGGSIFIGLDWFVLNLIFTGFLFVPLERLFPRDAEQPLFREDWKEDLFYYLVSSLFIQCLTFLALGPSRFIVAQTNWSEFRAWVSAQSFWLQFLEIMFLTDLVQYWLHRAFHRVACLWKFHAVHHSAQRMDWVAGAKMHFLEILVLRGTTVMPMMILGFHESPMHAYILMVYLYSTFIHSNVGWNLSCIGKILVTPRFHHWHHGIDREAIDVNFAIHFPFLDKIFGTHYYPQDKWPSGYGIKGHPVPKGYIRQFLYPFSKD